MNCNKVMDMVYEYSGNNTAGVNPIPLFHQFQIWMHSLICQNCALKIEYLEKARNTMKEDFFPTSPSGFDSWASLENSIMNKIAIETENEEEIYAIPGGISTRYWVITGLVILVSLITAFFGFDFQSVAKELGMSFMLPMGITIGIVLTSYGAFFIGSHLKELTERFGL